MVGLLVAMSGTAQWARRIGGMPPVEPGQPKEPPERHVAVMMMMLRGCGVILSACWLTLGVTAIVGGVMVAGDALGSGHTARALGGGAAGLGVGWLSIIVGWRLRRWRPLRSG
jgi:hypothetical protein